MPDSLTTQMVSCLNDVAPSIPQLDLLASVRLSGVLKADSILNAPWGVDLDHTANTIILYIVTEGQCIVQLDKDQSFQLSAGAALLAPLPAKISMSDNLGSPRLSLFDLINKVVEEAETADEQIKLLFRPPAEVEVTGEICRITTLRFFIDKSFPLSLLKGLPPLLKLDEFWTYRESFLRDILAHISINGSLGFLGQAIAIRLAESVFIAFLQDYFDSSTEKHSGIHAALRDPYLTKVISAIQREPGQNWTIKCLASLAGLSRSAFIERFTHVVGDSPNHYLVSVRMASAANLLTNKKSSISQIADQIGYGSEASFGRAFLKWAGVTPGQYRQQNSKA